MRKWLMGAGLSLTLASGLASAVQHTTANNGKLLMEDIPPIPESLPLTLSRYQNIRSASFEGWGSDSRSIFVKTRFGRVSQLHRVEAPRGARYQLTFGEEPVGEVRGQPRGGLLAITRDRGGDGFDQIFLLHPENGLLDMVSGGHAQNNRMAWDRQGRYLAFRSTRRNGRSSDIWVKDTGTAAAARVVLETEDGTLWKPVDFSRDRKKLLIQQFISVADSRIYLQRFPGGELQLLAGDADNPSTNIAAGFDSGDSAVLFVTNQREGAAELAKVSLDGEPVITFVPSVADWDISQFVLSPDRKRGAFVADLDGANRLYLFDPEKLAYKPVETISLALVSDLAFSPNSKRLGMTLNSARYPSDAFVLDLGRRPLSAGKLTRWTYSEVGGLDTDNFSLPIPVRYASPVDGGESVVPVPAFVYLPPGKGPFPVIIHVHGGPENLFRPRFNSEFQLWIDQLGAAVIAPNVRGSLGYGSRYVTLDDGYQREAAVKDIGALLDWIALQPQLDAGRVVIMGASYGGYVALAAAVHYSERLRAAVDVVGISNFVTFLENTQDYRRELRRVEYGDERDPAMRAFLQSISPLNNVDRIRIPLFIQQGRNDPVVPWSESEQMVRALRAQGGTVWYMNALNEGHGYQRKDNRDLSQQATFLFLQRYLLAED